MRKAILILTLALATLSCSNDKDNEPDILSFNDSKLGGIWYMSKVIQQDGSLLDYVHLCPSNKDWADLSTFQFKDYYHTQTCEVTFAISDCYPAIDRYTVTSCNDKYDGTYTLNGNTLTIDYGEVRSFPFGENNLLNAKGIVLTRN